MIRTAHCDDWTLDDLLAAKDPSRVREALTDPETLLVKGFYERPGDLGRRAHGHQPPRAVPTRERPPAVSA